MRFTQGIDAKEMLRRTLTLRHARFWAMHPDGVQFLHMGGTIFTKDPFYRWRGNELQFNAVNEIHGGILIPVNVSNQEKVTYHVHNDELPPRDAE